MERNYRSTSAILNAANCVIKNNSDRLGKTLSAERGDGKKPDLIFLPNQDDEAAFCAELIKKQVKKGGAYSDWAILYRTNAQSLVFESEFLHKRIPYQVVGTLKFYEREEIKDLLAFLALLANPKDEIAFRRIVNKPARGLGPTSQDKIIDAAKEKSQDLVTASKELAPSLSKKARGGLEQFCAIIESLKQKLNFNANTPGANTVQNSTSPSATPRPRPTIPPPLAILTHQTIPTRIPFPPQKPQALAKTLERSSKRSCKKAAWKNTTRPTTK